MSDVKKHFGETVRRHRLAIGLSQEELADLAHLHRTYIGGVERGERNISLVNILKLARAMNVKPADLMSQFHDK